VSPPSLNPLCTAVSTLPPTPLFLLPPHPPSLELGFSHILFIILLDTNIRISPPPRDKFFSFLFFVPPFQQTPSPPHTPLSSAPTAPPLPKYHFPHLSIQDLIFFLPLFWYSFSVSTFSWKLLSPCKFPESGHPRQLGDPRWTSPPLPFLLKKCYISDPPKFSSFYVGLLPSVLSQFAFFQPFSCLHPLMDSLFHSCVPPIPYYTFILTWLVTCLHVFLSFPLFFPVFNLFP